MKIKVLPRKYFEQIQGSPEESRILGEYKIISIQSSYGFDGIPPFSLKNLSSPHLLCLTFDDVTDEQRKMKDLTGYAYFNHMLAKEILRFVDEGEMPLLVHCTAGISRSGAVGEVLNWYFNRCLKNNQDDYNDFIRNNRQIIPNHIVKKILLKVIENEERKNLNNVYL